jgi:tetratricopeptide (TPR) repeat protein
LTETRKRTTETKAQEGERNNGADAPYIPGYDPDHRPSLSPPINAAITKKDSSSGEHAATRSPSDPEGKTERHLAVVLGASFNDLATAEALQEKYQAAYNHYREAARWDSRIPGLRRNLGLAAYFAGQPAETIRLLSIVVAQSPGDEQGRAVLGLAYFAKQDFAEAARTIAPIADRALQDPQLGFAWAKSLAETGSKKRAAQALQGLENANANLSVENLIQFAELWQELGETERAEQSFRRALVIDPANADARCALHLVKCR